MLPSLPSKPSANETPPGSLGEVFADLEMRFLSSLSRAELDAGSERVFFQMEQAWWRYEDSLADHYSHLPHFKKFEAFAREMCRRSAQLSAMNARFDELYHKFKDYQHRIPVYGAALLTADFKKVLMVTSFYGGATWGFPKGKVNEGEGKLECALREVYEEVGFDAAPLSPSPDDFITSKAQNGKTITIFIIPGVPEEFDFKPRVVKEIGEIRWHALASLPDNKSMHAAAETPAGKPEKYWGVAPFIPRLREWIANKTRRPEVRDAPSAASKVFKPVPPPPATALSESAFTVDMARVQQAMRAHLPLVV